MLTLNPIESSIDMIKRQQILKSLEDREYRREFAADIGTGLAFQVRLLREDRGWTQEQLAHRMGKRQETISQWENPDYGRYTLNTLRELAAAFDVALLVRFAPFSELVDWSINLTPERLTPPNFDEESQPTFTWAALPQDDSNQAQIPSRPDTVQEFMEALAVEEDPSEREYAARERRGEHAQVA